MGRLILDCFVLDTPRGRISFVHEVKKDAVDVYKNDVRNGSGDHPEITTLQLEPGTALEPIVEMIAEVAKHIAPKHEGKNPQILVLHSQLRGS